MVDGGSPPERQEVESIEVESIEVLRSSPSCSSNTHTKNSERGFFEAGASKTTESKPSVTSSVSKTKKAPRGPEQILESMPPNLILSTNPKFKAVFLNWISHGLQLKYPITNPQFEIHWEKCVLMGPEKAIRQIKFSIEHGRNNLDEIQVKSSVNGFQTSRGTKVVLPPL